MIVYETSEIINSTTDALKDIQINLSRLIFEYGDFYDYTDEYRAKLKQVLEMVNKSYDLIK